MLVAAFAGAGRLRQIVTREMMRAGGLADSHEGDSPLAVARELVEEPFRIVCPLSLYDPP